ncbi:activating signal cointegrator 1-like isoform X1 [Argonauta hians]
MAAPVVDWLCGELSRLGIEVTEENARYILTIDNIQDVEDYMKELLDTSDSHAQLFLTHFLKQWKQPVIKPLVKPKHSDRETSKQSVKDNSKQSVKDNSKQSVKDSSKQSSKENVKQSGKDNSKQSGKENSSSNNREKSQTPPARIANTKETVQNLPSNKFYQKSKSGEDYFGGTSSKKSKSKGAKPKVSEPTQNKPAAFSEPQFHVSQAKITNENSAKKKKKFVPLYSSEGVARTVVQLPGRHSCNCQALKHDLVNNCIECGRIICEQEGAGPCLFCGNLVCSKEHEKILAEGSKKSEKLLQTLTKDTDKVLQLISNQIQKLSTENSATPQSDDLSKAVDYKNRLLDYDNTSVKRTKVIDDDADYFSSDSQWLSKSEREVLKRREDELRNIRFQSRRDRKVTLDFAGRRIIDEEEEAFNKGTNMYEAEKERFMTQAEEKPSVIPQNNGGPLGDLVNPSIKIAAPKFIQPVDMKPMVNNQGVECSFSEAVEQGKRLSIRLQDREILEMRDDGYCLSMHQPYASLLIAGIKLHEGRTWYTSHRGKLWIASTAKPPLQEEIDSLESVYRAIYKEGDVVFPKFYQPGCLLGCVDLVDCLEQGEYRNQFPDGESGSPYVFICQNPKELVVNFPIKGKHKIFKLESHIHQGAKKGLRKNVYDEG